MTREAMEGIIRQKIVSHEARHNFVVPAREELVKNIADAEEEQERRDTAAKRARNEMSFTDRLA